MKKWVLLFLAALIALSLVGCGGVSEEEYRQVREERDALRQELQELQDSMETEKQDKVQAVISGTFTATVRGLIPDYVFDDTTPMMGVVTLFQSPPFLMYTGEFTDQLEVGETYVFEIEPKTVELTAEEYEANFPDPEVVFPKFNLRLSGFRESVESDWGLDSVHLTYELCD